MCPSPTWDMLQISVVPSSQLATAILLSRRGKRRVKGVKIDIASVVKVHASVHWGVTMTSLGRPQVKTLHRVYGDLGVITCTRAEEKKKTTENTENRAIPYLEVQVRNISGNAEGAC